MGRKTNPGLMRLGIIKDWSSKWFDKKNYVEFLREDTLIRAHIEEKHQSAGVEKVLIERDPNLVSVVIRTSRPGLIIGRSGSGIEELKKEPHQNRSKVDLKLISSREEAVYRVRLGKYRMVFEIDEDNKVVTLTMIFPRDRGY